MNKKVVIISVIAVLLLGLLIFLIFTRLGQEITQYLMYRITTPKETVIIEEKEKIKITYTYRWQEEKFDIEVDEKLTEKAGIFETDHITISKKDNVEEVVEIKERTIIEYKGIEYFFLL